jgi:hypothetical protein
LVGEYWKIFSWLFSGSFRGFSAFLALSSCSPELLSIKYLGFWAEFFLKASGSFSATWTTQYSGSVLGDHYKTLSEVLRTGGFVHIVTSSFVFVSWEFFGEGSELGNNGHVGVPMALQKNCCTFLGVFGSARGGPIT